MLRQLLSVVVLLACTATATASSPPQLMSIADVHKRHESLDGQTVRVRGWIVFCQPLGCPLADSLDEKVVWKSRTAWLSLGHSPAFDKSLLKVGGKVAIATPSGRVPSSYRHGRVLFVEIEGRVDRTCFLHDGEPVPNDKICLDRAGEILNPRLIQVIKTGPAPKQGR